MFLHQLRMLQHQDPVGSGLASDAIVEAAGPDCIVPGQIKPVRLLGLKVFFSFFFFGLWYFVIVKFMNKFRSA